MDNTAEREIGELQKVTLRDILEQHTPLPICSDVLIRGVPTPEVEWSLNLVAPSHNVNLFLIPLIGIRHVFACSFYNAHDIP